MEYLMTLLKFMLQTVLDCLNQAVTAISAAIMTLMDLALLATTAIIFLIVVTFRIAAIVAVTAAIVLLVIGLCEAVRFVAKYILNNFILYGPRLKTTKAIKKPADNRRQPKPKPIPNQRKLA